MSRPCAASWAIPAAPTPGPCAPTNARHAAASSPAIPTSRTRQRALVCCHLAGAPPHALATRLSSRQKLRSVSRSVRQVRRLRLQPDLRRSRHGGLGAGRRGAAPPLGLWLAPTAGLVAAR